MTLKDLYNALLHAWAMAKRFADTKDVALMWLGECRGWLRELVKRLDLGSAHELPSDFNRATWEGRIEGALEMLP